MFIAPCLISNNHLANQFPKPPYNRNQFSNLSGWDYQSENAQFNLLTDRIKELIPPSLFEQILTFLRHNVPLSLIGILSTISTSILLLLSYNLGSIIYDIGKVGLDIENVSDKIKVVSDSIEAQVIYVNDISKAQNNTIDTLINIQDRCCEIL